LLIDAGLARGEDVSYGSEDPEAILQRITWAGHEFIEAARDDNRWQKAKNIVVEKGGDITLDILKALLVNLTKSTLGLP
jgi:hypothetical protein